MRIAVTTPYYPPADGGIAIFIRESTRELKAIDHEVKVYARFGDEAKVEIIKGGKLRFVIRVARKLQKFKPEAIHAHSTWYALAAGVCYKIFHHNVKLIFTFHTGQINELPILKESLFRWLLNKCDYVTFVSNALRIEAERTLKLLTKNVVVYAGVNHRESQINDIEDFKLKHNIQDEGIIITSIGPFEWKMKVEGFKLLIQAFKEVISIEKKSRLLLIGDGRLRNELEELVEKLALKEHVVFTGFVPNVFIPLHFTSVYAHISLQEGLPLALLEAMSAGVPVVASRTGGIPEVIIDGENGLLVDSDIASISGAIFKIINNNDLRTGLSQNAKETIESTYSWSNTSKHFFRLYKGGRI